MMVSPMKPDARTDVELLAAWAEGASEAADALLRRYFDVVFRFFSTKLDRGLEDLVQRTFLACLEARQRFRGDSSFSTFLLGIARHQLLRVYREHHRESKMIDPAQVSVRDLTGTPSAVLAGAQEQRILLAGLRAIPLDLQIALELHYWEELPIADIAEILELPPGTVKSRLFRARTLLRERIAELASTDAPVPSTMAGLDAWARSMRARLPQGA
jgi:RNA polymerase sigma-70 factor (ECF subfamily)